VALNIDPQHKGAIFEKAILLDKLGHKEEAIRLYDKLLGLDPLSGIAYYNKGNILYYMGRREEALACFVKL
jgi:tetratricopeptide (TPR) repeat protein